MWLQVCPLSVMSNWETQIEEHSGGKLSCIRFHGPARYKLQPAELAAADVVVTTYGILASDKMTLKRVRFILEIRLLSFSMTNYPDVVLFALLPVTSTLWRSWEWQSLYFHPRKWALCFL